LEPCGSPTSLYIYGVSHPLSICALRSDSPLQLYSFTVFEQIKAKTYAFQPTTSVKTISWQCAILFPRPNGHPVVLLVADHNRINSCYILLRSHHFSVRNPQRNCDPQWNCDPRLNWPAYETKIRQCFIQLGQQSGKSIFEILLQNKACFNGFGLNLATEALHRARIHPMWASQLVFQTSDLREQLLRGLQAIATEDVALWNKYIQQHVNLDDPFHYNQRAIEFYQQYMNRVYDKKDCLVPTDICATLFRDGLLVFLLLLISIDYRYLSHFEKALLKKLCADVFLFTKSGGSTNHLVNCLRVHQARIPIPLLKPFRKPITRNIIYIKGIPHFDLLNPFSKRHIPSKSENRPQTGPDHFFYSIQRNKIEKSVQTKVGRKMKLASRTVKSGRPKKASPVKPTSEQLIETFKGLKLTQRIGKFSRNGRRIVA
jgi:hypothetical protein